MPRLVALGGLALLGVDGPLTGSAARGRNLALLALLARAGERGSPKEELAACLWPESPADRSRHSLDQSIYTLRRALGPDALSTGPTSLVLSGDVVASDVSEFSLACESGDVHQAVSLYAGPFLDGFHLPGSSMFEHWVDGERSLLHRQWTAALEAIAREVSAGGDAVAAVGYWRRLAAAEPLNARVNLNLMKALDLAGDRNGALQAAAAHTLLVRDELDAEPDESIVRYEIELRRTPRSNGGAVALAERRAVRRPIIIDTGASGSSNDGGRHAERPAPGFAGRAPPGRRGVRRLWFGLVGAAVVITTSLTVLASRSAPWADARPLVVVTPFENETGEAHLDPLGRMAADWIVEGMVRTGLLAVGDRTGDPSVRSMVSGRVYTTGDTVWFQARITGPNGEVQRALDAVRVWAASPTDALEPLRQKVLGALGTLYDLRLDAWAESALRPPSFAAYQAFAGGLDLFAVPRDLAGASARFRLAAELDPDYALPRLWLAWASVLLGDWSTADSVVVAVRSQRPRLSPVERAWLDRIAASLAGDNEASYIAARRMVEITPRSGWVLALSKAALDTNRPRVAISALQSVGVANLGLEREHGWFNLTVAYHRLGDYRRELAATDEAIADVGLNWGYLGAGLPALAALGRVASLEQRLEELRVLPASEDGVPWGRSSLLTAATELRAHGYVDEAAAIADRMIDREDTPPPGPDGQPARWARLQLLYEMGWWQDAERMLADALAADSATLGFRAMGGLLAARRGDAATARRAAAELAAIEGPFLFGEPTFWRARIEAVLGNSAESIRLLRQSFAEGQTAHAWQMLHVSRDFDSLRRDRSFIHLVRAASDS